jgi:drug/metabolite transporter (DMT)-like permease
MTPAPGRWSGALLVVVGASLFGTLGPLSRFAYDVGLTPFAWVSWRATIGAVGLVAVIVARRGWRSSLDSIRAATPAARGWLALATLAAACLNLAFFVAFQRTTIALALLGFYTYPAMVAATSSLLGHERLDGTRRVALLLAILGMVGVVAGGLSPTSAVTVDAIGIGLALVAAGCQTTFVVSSRGYASMPTEDAMAAVLAGSAVISVGAAILTDGPAVLAQPFGDPGLLALLLFVGIFAAALPSFLFLNGIRTLGPIRAGILMLFEPVVGVVLAAVVLGEGVTPLQVLGGGTILLAAALVQRGTRLIGQGTSLADAPVAPAPGGP